MTAMCSGSASSKTVAKQIKLLKTFSPLLIRLQCFDTVGWVAGRASGLEKLSGGVLARLSAWSEVQTCICPSWCHCHSLSLASVKSRLILPFWCRPTWVVPDKGPLNMCVCVICWYFVTAPAAVFLHREQHISSPLLHLCTFFKWASFLKFLQIRLNW